MTEEEIKALARILDRVDYYRLIKAEREASDSEIRAAYHQARRRFHPDSFLGQDRELCGAVDQIARRLTEGYLVLRDRRKRSAYNAALETGAVRYTSEIDEQAKAKISSQRGQTPNGKKFYTLAEEEERREDIEKAVSHLRMALTFEPGNEHFKQELERLRPPKRKKQPKKS